LFNSSRHEYLAPLPFHFESACAPPPILSRFYGKLTYRPSAVGDFLLAVHLEIPVGGASDLQIVDCWVPHTGVHQVHARVALQWSIKLMYVLITRLVLAGEIFLLELVWLFSLICFQSRLKDLQNRETRNKACFCFTGLQWNVLLKISCAYFFEALSICVLEFVLF